MSSQRPDAWPVQTSRLRIRRCTVDDLDTLWEYRRMPDVNRWLGRAPDTREAFHATYAEPARLASTLVIEALDGRDERPTVVGDVMVRIEDGWAQAEVAEQAKGVQAELGWVLHPDHSGRGYATEAMRAVIDTCFGPLGLRRVHAGCFTVNERSWRLMERLGMRREEDSRKTGLHRSGEWLDGRDYALLAEEWTVSLGHPPRRMQEIARSAGAFGRVHPAFRAISCGSREGGARLSVERPLPAAGRGGAAPER